MAISLAEAKQILDGAIAQAGEFNIKVSAAVVDNGGRLIAMNKMDGAIWGSTYGCIGKAVGSSDKQFDSLQFVGIFFMNRDIIIDRSINVFLF